VHLSTILKVAKKLQCTPNELIRREVDVGIPESPEFYESLTHGYFVDHTRSPDDNEVVWNPETISLKRDPHSDTGWEWFSGFIVNAKQERFEVRASLIQGKVFTILASNEKRPDGFSASFSNATSPSSNPSKRVLCGIWSGVDHVSRMAVYRMFCSQDPLTGTELSKLQHEVQIVTKFEDDATANQPKHLAIRKPITLKTNRVSQTPRRSKNT